jgi:Domain of unknown function (DUF6484)
VNTAGVVILAKAGIQFANGVAMSAAAIEVFESVMSEERSSAPIRHVVLGTLIGFANEARTPLVIYEGQPGSAALAALAVLDLQGTHIGKRVVLQFDRGDPKKPVILGLVREGDGWPLPEQPGQVQVDVDGERLLVTAKEQLVLKCGKASITLTKAGKVLVQGTYVSNRSSGVMRIKGGSVQLN